MSNAIERAADDIKAWGRKRDDAFFVGAQVNVYIDGFLAAMEQIRRMTLLTPENVRVVCEREGFESDEGSDGYDPDSPVFTDHACEWQIGKVGNSPYWVIQDADGIALDHLCLTIGALEDAIAAAKGVK